MLLKLRKKGGDLFKDIYIINFYKQGGFLSMAKNKQGKRKRSFKVHSDFNGNPFVRFGGKYLPKELGITCGDRLELINDNGLIVLRKFSAEEVAQYETAQKEKVAQALLKKLLPKTPQPKQAPPVPPVMMPVMMVAEASTTTYSVEEEKQRKIYSMA